MAGIVGVRALHRPSESHYFGIGKIDRDQIADYARRKGWTVAEAERWLAQSLDYDPTSELVASGAR